MSTTIELPNVEYTQDFIEMCTTLRFQRQKEKDEATSIKINAQKQKNNAQLVEDNQSAIEIEKQMHVTRTLRNISWKQHFFSVHLTVCWAVVHMRGSRSAE